MPATRQQIADSLGITVTERPNLKSIQLTYGDRTLSPDSYEDWRLACQCLALRKPAHQPVDYFQLWVDWSRQSETVKRVDMIEMMSIWLSYTPKPMPQLSEVGEGIFEMLPGNKIVSHMGEKPAPRESVQLKMKRLHEQAVVPTFGTAGAACFDLYAILPGSENAVETFYPHAGAVSATVETGWAFEVPEGWVMKVYSRSGQGFKDNTRLANCVGIIDSDYRGPLRVKLTRDDSCDLVVRQFDRVAQAMLERVPVVELIEVDELSDTQRGEAGYGSTGR